MKYCHIPNLLTILRMILVLPMAYCLMREWYGLSLFLFALAAASDSIDGLIARQFHCSSNLGAILDPIADKLLIVATFILLTWIGKLPVWLCELIILRDVSIMIGAYYWYFIANNRKISPSWISKLNTAAQFMLLSLALASTNSYNFPQAFINLSIYLVAFTTLASGINYLTWLKFKLRQVES